MRNLETLRALLAVALAAFFYLGFASANGETPATTPPAETAGETQQYGLGIFSRLPFRVSATLHAGYDDNVNNAATNKQGSTFTSGGVEVSYGFGGPRMRFSLSAGAGGTYYYERISNQGYDIDFHLDLGLQYKASPRLTLGSSVYAAYLTEPNFNYGLGVDRRSGNYFNTVDKLSANYTWAPRFSTASSYTLVVVKYDNSAIAVFQDRADNTFGNEFRFLLQPTTTLVVDYRYEIVSYAHTTQITQDSSTQFVLAGIDHSFNPLFNASLRGGAEFRSYEATGSQTGPYAETTANYAAGKRTSLSWTNHYGIEEPNVPGTPSRTTYRTSLQIRQQIVPRITATLSFNYAHDDNQGVTGTPSFSQDSLDIALSARYAITNYLGIDVGYNRTQVLSDIFLQEYARNRFSGGLNFAF